MVVDRQYIHALVQFIFSSGYGSRDFNKNALEIPSSASREVSPRDARAAYGPIRGKLHPPTLGKEPQPSNIGVELNDSA